MKELTDRQMQALDFVLSYIQKNNMPPTLVEVGAQLGITPVAAANILDAMAKKGVITRGSGTRGIRLVGYETELRRI